MKSFALVLLALLAPVARPQLPAALRLKAEQIPPDCLASDGDFPADMQTAMLWRNTGLYKAILPDPVAKNTQSFDCSNNKGSVYFFQFAGEDARKQAASFLKPLLWGEPHLTARHPELVLENASPLPAVSFRQAPESLLAALETIAPSAPAADDAAGA